MSLCACAGWWVQQRAAALWPVPGGAGGSAPQAPLTDLKQIQHFSQVLLDGNFFWFVASSESDYIFWAETNERCHLWKYSNFSTLPFINIFEKGKKICKIGPLTTDVTFMKMFKTFSTIFSTTFRIRIKIPILLRRCLQQFSPVVPFSLPVCAWLDTVS